MASQSIPFIDLAAQRSRLGSAIDDAIGRVLAHGQYILGPEVKSLEADLAEFCGAKHVVACSNGTDALALILRARGLQAGDAVFCPSFTFAATAEVIAWFGATPIFIDVFPDTFNIDPASLERGIATARQLGLKPVCVMPVDLFGQPADYDAIEPICAAEKIWILSDAAQSFGATYKRRKIGTIGLATATSFFPAKPLGCYGDGGAIFTDDAELADMLRSLRMHGQGVDKYDNAHIGMNARLDTIQAAVLIEKLKIFSDEIDSRQIVVNRYNEGLKDVAVTPVVLDDCVSTWAQYTIRIRNGRRDAVASALKEQGIPTAIYYPKPLHRQTAYRHFPSAGNGLPVSDAVAQEVLSLPMHPYLAPALQDRIMQATRDAIAG